MWNSPKKKLIFRRAGIDPHLDTEPPTGYKPNP